MRLSPKALKWVLRAYPPFFFQRIWIKKVHPDFKQIDIRVSKSLFNINSNRTIFGGTIFASVDPIHTLLFDQIIRRRGIKRTVTWLKSAHITYLKPAKVSLNFSVKLSEREIDDALKEALHCGKMVKTFEIDIFDSSGVLCAKSYNEIYIRDLDFELKH